MPATTTTTLPSASVVRRYENACLQYVVRAPFLGGVHLIAQRGLVVLSFDFAALSDVGGDGLEDVPVTITEFDFSSQHAQLGAMRVTLGPDTHPDRASFGLLSERRNNFPGQFDLPPTVFAGDADLTLQPWLLFEIMPVVRNVLHHDDALVLSGVVNGDPLATEDSFLDTDPTTRRPLLFADDEGWFATTVANVRLTPLAASCGQAASVR